MHPTTLLPLLLSLTTAAVLPSQHRPNQHSLSVPPQDVSSTEFHFPTIHESTIMARRLLQLSGYGTLSTIFPSHDSGALLSSDLHTLENRPSSVAHLPFGLPEYIADCEPGTGNPTILQVDIANTFKNAAAGSNVTLSVPWTPPGRLEGEYSAAMMPRVAVVGWLQELFPGSDDETGPEGPDAERIKECWLQRHPDTIWAPGSDIHISRWTRLVVQEVFWFGGFGDRARIMWLDPEEYRNVTPKEIDAMRLPGEMPGDDVGKGSLDEL